MPDGRVRTVGGNGGQRPDFDTIDAIDKGNTAAGIASQEKQIRNKAFPPPAR